MIDKKAALEAESTVTDYYSLLKPRVMFLVVFTAFIGLYVAPGKIHPFTASLAILAITIASGAAASLNMWYDRDIDAVMLRTQKRPLVTGKIKADDCLAYGLILSIFSIILMALATNLLSAFLLFFTIFFYIVIYTIILKRRSVQNIVIGGAAGALPPMIGWTSVTNNIDINAIWLFIIIFLWTPAHFWALALFKSDDYEKANVPMMPIIKGKAHTIKQILIYTIATIISSFSIYYTELVGNFYLIIAIITGAYYLFLNSKLYLNYNEAIAKKSFIYSIFYLFVLYLAIILDKILF